MRSVQALAAAGPGIAFGFLPGAIQGQCGGGQDQEKQQGGASHGASFRCLPMIRPAALLLVPFRAKIGTNFA